MKSKPKPPLLRIEDAPMRVRLEYYRGERRNNIIAVLVIASVVAAVAWGIWKLIA